MLNRVRPKKSLGQNFLRDKNIIRKIVSSLEIKSSDIVIEIGPGEGALTEFLVAETNNLIAIEIDKRCVELLKIKFPEIEVINQNFLDFSFSKLSNEKMNFVGNIPYNITSQILFHIFENINYVKNFTAMMQKEVAMRLVAKPKTKDYGILSVMTQYFSSPKILFDVSKNCFYPKPKITSTVVNLNFENKKIIRALDEDLFRALVRGTFNTRRKTMKNGLKKLNLNENAFLIAEKFLNLRPEEISPEGFVELSNLLTQNGIKLNVKN